MNGEQEVNADPALEEFRSALRDIRATALDDVTDAQLSRLRTASEGLPLSPSDVGHVNRTLLLPQILRVKSPAPSDWSHLLGMCNAFRSTEGFVRCEPFERALLHVFEAKAHLAGALSLARPPEDRRASIGAAKDFLALAKHLCDQYGLADLAAQLRELEDVQAGMARDEVTTRIRFDVPFAVAVHDGDYEMNVGCERPAIVRVRYRPPAYPRFGNQVDEMGVGIPIPGDWAQLQATPDDQRTARVESRLSSRVQSGFDSFLIDVPYLVDPFADELRPPAVPEEGEGRIDPLAVLDLPAAFHVAARITNDFVDHVRAASGRYEFERISAADIEAVSVSVWVGGWLVFRLPLTGGGPYRISVGNGKPAEWTEKLRTQLLGASVGPIERLVLDAHQYIVQDELRLAVLNINAALELFVNTHVFERLAEVVPHEEIESFMGGVDILESARAYLMEMAESGDAVAADAADVIPPHPDGNAAKLKPSVYRIVKFMDRHRSFGLTRSELNRLVNEIRVYRNEVAHGQVGDRDLDSKQVANALKQLEEFRAKALNTM